MKNVKTYFFPIILQILLAFAAIYPVAAEDDGTDTNGTFLLSPVLTLRCGLDSKSPEITEDCIRRLAYDYQTNAPVGYANYTQERQAIIGDYAKAYLVTSINGMIAAGNYETRIDQLVGKDPTIDISLDGDAREDIEFNNKLSSDNSTSLLNAIGYSAAVTNMENIRNILDTLVPATEIDVNENTDLAGPPSGGAQ